ncbi:sigma-54-dependent Fis family transcriptional regulator [candidate division WOR-3 bacterium]|nr:sigma-54-dependent Fis family transcriptional regulator [candidate division WOR-3 bacterium]
MARILLVDDIDNFREMLKRNIKKAGFEVYDFPSGEYALKNFNVGKYDAAIFDLKLKGMDGIALMERVKKIDNIPIIIITAYGDVEIAIKAIKSGAWDFIQKPFDPDGLIFKLKKAIDERRRALLSKEGYEIIGDSEDIRKAKELALKVAPTDTTVLLTGESGTGKELFARAIHKWSKRDNKPFVVINSAAIPDTLVESELFGIEKGTATGVEERIGKIELAEGGTVFFDEIGDMPPSTQAKVLRVIEEKKIQRIGGRTDIPVNVRIITATNRDLNKLLKEEKFREDLYYRLSVFPINLSPLREKKSDIDLLANFFLKKYSVLLNKKIKGIDSKALKKLKEYNWPGNVRELENIIERSIILSEDDLITEKDIIILKEEKPTSLPLDLKVAGDIGRRKSEVEVIKKALRISNNNKVKAAKLLNVSYKTLYNKIKEYEI